MSGEHGDGRARSELLPRMYSPAGDRPDGAGQADPRPRPTCSTPACWSTRRRSTPTCGWPPPSGPSAPRSSSPTTTGRSPTPCTAAPAWASAWPTTPASGGVMCPSYLATRDEKDSTRGRAHVLQDVANGTLGFDDPAVADALDLCLSCKGCARDCPTGIDMATYKSEALSQKYAGAGLRRRAPTTPSAQLPRWARMTPPRLANTMLRSKTVARIAKAAAGRRPAPQPAARSPSGRCAEAGTPRCRPNVDVWIWADSFTDRFAADTGRARDRAAGVDGPARCGDPRAGLLRPDLDHHRPARPPRGASSARRSQHAARLRRLRHPGDRARAELPGRDPRGRRPAARRPPGRRGQRRRRARSRSSSPHGSRRGSGPRPT